MRSFSPLSPIDARTSVERVRWERSASRDKHCGESAQRAVQERADAEFDGLFTSDRPVIFAYHGYPYLIHRLTYKRKNHDNIHERGFNEEWTTTTPFDMVVLNKLDRFHLAMDVIERVPGLGPKAAHVKRHFRHKLIEHRNYIDQHGEDMPEIQNWSWPYNTATRATTDVCAKQRRAGSSCHGPAEIVAINSCDRTDVTRGAS